MGKREAEEREAGKREAGGREAGKRARKKGENKDIIVRCYLAFHL